MTGYLKKNALAVAALSATTAVGFAFGGLWATALAQSSAPVAMESQVEGAVESNMRLPTTSPVMVERVPQPAFAWAVSDWMAIEPVRSEAQQYEDNGYFVRIIPNKGLTRFRVTIGHSRSQEEARDYEIALPMPVRRRAELIPIERYVVSSQSERTVKSATYTGSGSGSGFSRSTSASGAGSDPDSDLLSDSRSSGTVQEDETGRRRRSQPPPGPLLQPFELRFAMSSIFDSNIDHDQEDQIRAVGLVPAMMLRYRSTVTNPILVVSYGVARHRYSQTEKWDRTSHMVLLRLQPRMDGAFRMETDLDLTSNGSFEDRDLSDQIQAVQSLEYRFTRDYRLHAYGTLRWKYPKLNDDDAFKPNVGVIFEQKLDGDRTWEMGARYEVNLEEIERGNYTRWTFELEYEIELSERTELEFGIKHRRKNYWNKEVEIEDEDYPRRDQRWVLGTSLDFALAPNVFTNLRYQFEARSSNDPEKPFDAHLVDFGVYVLL